MVQLRTWVSKLSHTLQIFRPPQKALYCTVSTNMVWNIGTNKKSISNRLTKLRAERNATTGGDPSVYTSKSKSAAKASASKEATTKGRGGKKPKAANDSAKRKAEDDDNDDEKESKKAKVEDEDEEAEEVNKGV